MWIALFLVNFFVTTTVFGMYDKIGYFWHITDFHYDPFFTSGGDSRKGCRRTDGELGGNSRNYRRAAGRFGDHACDSPWDLVDSAAKIMAQKQADNVEFVLWTGDALSHSISRHDKTLQLDAIQNLTDLLTKTFSSQFVFPALGHDDPAGYKQQLGKMWSRWLPTDSLKTFESAGYYLIERKMHKLQIVVLNTNLMRRKERDEEAKKQWHWLENVLNKCQKYKETVYIVGHIPPGSYEKQGLLEISYENYHNKKYLEMVRKFSKIIVGQFFGHLHSDTFRLVYDEEGTTPISWIFVAPSLTPRKIYGQANNPGLRLYKFDRYSGEIFDYTQYYLELPKNNKETPKWQVEYNFTSYYGTSQITPLAVHSVAEKLASNEHKQFFRYLKANGVGVANICEQECALHHYCAITRLDFGDFDLCLDSVSSALASSGKNGKRTSSTCAFLIGAIFCFKLVMIAVIS